jgi:hypothetical protein
MLLLLFGGASSEAPATTSPIVLVVDSRDTALSLPDKSTAMQPAARDTNLSLEEER